MVLSHSVVIFFMCKSLLSVIKNYNLFSNNTILELKFLRDQGLCNTTCLLNTHNSSYIVKKFEKPLHVNKKFEFQIQSLAYKKGISPKPILLDTANLILISKYLEGKHKNILNRNDLKTLAHAINNIHKIKIYTKPYDIERYLKKNSNKISKELKLALLDIKKFEKDFVLCHNDLNPRNIIFADKIKFIDWEFASINDRYFDLAGIIVEFNLNKKYESFFLKHYFKKCKYNRKKLEAYKIIYKYTCKIWFDKISQKRIINA